MIHLEAHLTSTNVDSPMFSKKKNVDSPTMKGIILLLLKKEKENVTQIHENKYRKRINKQKNCTYYPAESGAIIQK